MNEETEKNQGPSFAIINGIAALLNNHDELAAFKASPEKAIEIASKWGVKLDRERAIFLSASFGQVASLQKDVTEAIALAIGGPIEWQPGKGPGGGGDGPSIRFCLTIKYRTYVATRFALSGPQVHVGPTGDPEH